MGVWRLLRSSRARISARNIVYELVHLSQVIERSYICESERESSTGKFRFIIMAAVFDRFVIPSSHARLVSRTRVSIPMYYCDSLSVGYFGSPGLEFIPGREKISGIRGTNDSVGWLRYSKLDEIDEWQTFRSNIQRVIFYFRLESFL